jgi:hypothetical protein
MDRSGNSEFSGSQRMVAMRGHFSCISHCFVCFVVKIPGNIVRNCSFIISFKNTKNRNSLIINDIIKIAATPILRALKNAAILFP